MFFMFLFLFMMMSHAAWAMARRPPLPAENTSISVTAASAAQEREPVWTLSDLLKEALEKNPEIQVYKERWKAAKARVWQEISWEDTTVGADFEGIPRGRADADRASDIEWMISQKNF